MRMWLVNPILLCRQHLLGEHAELHMLVGAIKKGKNIQGYIDKGLIELGSINARHDQLANEMFTRGYRHNSPLEKINLKGGYININESLNDLYERCKECRQRINFYKKGGENVGQAYR